MLTLLRRRKAASVSRAPRYRAAPHVLAARHGDRTILLDARRGRYFGLDPVGASIWRLLGEGATAAELVAGLDEEYTALREQLEQDVASFLSRLERARLVVSA